VQVGEQRAQILVTHPKLHRGEMLGSL
jgi:hypothetical protein